MEGPPENELISETGRLNDADPASRSELRDSVIVRETCEASWVTSVAGTVGKARVVVAVAEVEAGTSGSVVSGRGAVKASVTGGKASEMNSIGGGRSLVLRDGRCCTGRLRLGGIRIRTKKNCKDTVNIVYTTQDINTRLDNKYKHITQKKQERCGVSIADSTRCHCNQVAIPLCC